MTDLESVRDELRQVLAGADLPIGRASRFLLLFAKDLTALRPEDEQVTGVAEVLGELALVLLRAQADDSGLTRGTAAPLAPLQVDKIKAAIRNISNTGDAQRAFLLHLDQVVKNGNAETDMGLYSAVGMLGTIGTPAEDVELLIEKVRAALRAWDAVSKGASVSKWGPCNECLAFVGLGANSPAALEGVWKKRPRAGG